MGGFFPFPGQSVYGASKAAVKILTEGLYAELLDTDVQVSVIFPGAVKTSISTNSGVDEPAGAEDSKVPMTTPEKAARIMLDGIEKGRLHIFLRLDRAVDEHRRQDRAATGHQTGPQGDGEGAGSRSAGQRSYV